jgi:hypothetical protein
MQTVRANARHSQAENDALKTHNRGSLHQRAVWARAMREADGNPTRAEQLLSRQRSSTRVRP